MDPNLTRSSPSARFWAALSPSAREALERRGVEAPTDATAAEGAPKADTTGARAKQLREDGDERPRADRRRAAALERQAPPATRPQPGSARKAKRGRGRPRTRADRDAARARQFKRDSDYLERLRDRMGKNLPDEPPPELRLIPRSVLVLCREALADPSGRAIRIRLQRERNKVAVGMIREAALVPGADGQTRYDWSDLRARCIAALGLSLLELSAPTRRKGAWSSVVRGVTRSALAWLLANPWEPSRRPHVNTISGRHRPNASLESGQVGYLRALELVGFCYAQQLPADEAEPFERWRVRKRRGSFEVTETHASNRYWVITACPTAPLDDDEKRRLIGVHTAGLAAHERPQRAPRSSWYPSASSSPTPGPEPPS